MHGLTLRLSLRGKLIIAFAAVLLITLILSMVALWATEEDREAAEWVTHTYDVITDIESILADLTMIQNSYRGYLLAGVDEYLSPYEASLRTYETTLEILRWKTSDNPTQLERWDVLEQQVSSWREDVLEPGIALRDEINVGEASLADAQEYARTANGFERFAEISAILDEGAAHELDLLDARQAETESTYERVRLTLIAGTGIALALGVAVTWLLSHDIGSAMESLTRQARRIADGDLDARIGSARPDEIGLAATAFDDMADKLQLAMEQLQSAARQAQEREAQLRAIVENAAEGILAIRADGTIATANPAAQTMFAPDGPSVVGRCLDDMIEAPDGKTQLTFADLRPDPSSELSVHRAASGVRADGGTFQLEAVISTVPGRDHELYIGIVRDITERRRAEDQLHAQVLAAERAQSSTKAVLDAAGEAMILIAPDTTILSVNRRFCEFFGVDMDEVSGSPMALYGERLDKTFTDADRFRTMLYQSINDTESSITDTFQQKWPVPRDLEFHSIFVKTERGEHLGRLFAFRDVTHQRALDRMKNEFVSLVSHELRTPLTSIKGYVDLLLDGEVGELDPDQQEFLEIVSSNAERLVSLINDLLDISRIEAGKVELALRRVDPHGMIQRIVTSFRPQLEAKGQHVSVEIEPDIPPVWADEDRLTQVFTNLISNAHKYTPSKGTIRLSVRASERDVVFDIADTGIGMSEEELAKLFTRFYRAQNRTTQEVGGTGLGLSITQSLVELHGGSITVSSRPGEGSTFTVTIPQAGAATSAVPASTANAHEGGSILIIEDDTDIARLIQRYLKRSGYTAVIASDARSAMETVHRETFDLITLDVMLPDTDGFALLEWLKTDPATSDTPIVMLSMLPDDGTGERLGAVDYVVKPVNERSLVSRIEGVLHREPSARVMVADDDDDIRRLISRHLRSAGYQVIEAVNGKQVLELLETTEVDLLLLDVRMPEMDGIEALATLR
ncbi:MAG TPA: response regulator, partial [Thermomicrobiales bacterium]|nr:response regulator [Thermomicrobiales bacterium]